MGTDKAALSWGSQSLWERQRSVLEATRPAELWISGRKTGPYAGSSLPILEDPVPGLGPLAGLVEGLRRAQHAFLLVLGIDLPWMNAGFLSGLMEEAWVRKKGVVPRNARWWEPLAAVYPREILPLAEECLQHADRSLQRLVRLGMECGLLESRELGAGEGDLFRNVNSPGDLPAPGMELC
jgi:molybdopterin-guanine dinucleotide biosynthesis protein A